VVIPAAAEVRYGTPRELSVAYEITPAELAMGRALDERTMYVIRSARPR
jgi:hypothetical protein